MGGGLRRPTRGVPSAVYALCNAHMLTVLNEEKMTSYKPSSNCLQLDMHCRLYLHLLRAKVYPIPTCGLAAPSWHAIHVFTSTRTLELTGRNMH